jgi:hypothetical protein
MQINEEELSGAIARLSAAVRRPLEKAGISPEEGQLRRDLALVVSTAQLACARADRRPFEADSVAKISELIGRCSTVVVLERPDGARILEYKPGLSDLAKETMEQIMIGAQHGRVYLAAIVAEITSRGTMVGGDTW